MSNHTDKRSKKDDKKKLAVRVLCIVLAVLMGLSAFVGVLGFFA